MEVWFDTDFDGGAWPGPLRGGTASAGEAWRGPRGFLDLLETHLGLSGRHEPDGIRAARLIPRFSDARGFWDRSAEADPLGTARVLLHWRDTLCLCGWDGQGASPRLRQLSALTRELPPGAPDRLAAAIALIPQRDTEIEAVHLQEPATALPLIWQRLFTALAVRDVRVVIDTVAVPSAQNDIAAAREGRFTPAFDGSLQLIRPRGPLAAAEEVAAWLAAEDGRETLIVSPEPVLDAALHAHGLPTMGCTARGGQNALLEVLPLVISMGWQPPDPARALELLTLPAGPVPHDIAWRLVGALTEWPAVGSDHWNRLLREGLDGMKDADRRKATELRLERIFTASARGGEYPVAELRARVALTRSWLLGRRESEKDPTPHWGAAIAQCAAFERLLDATGLSRVGPAQLKRLLDDAAMGAADIPRHAAQAGFSSVAVPGAVAGAVARVVWWSFTRQSAAGVERLPFSREECNELHGLGVRLQDPAELAASAARRWRRPLAFAEERLLLVCPRVGADGEEQSPHPLWDEIAAAVPDGRSVRGLEHAQPVSRPAPRKTAGALLPIPEKRDEWNLPRTYSPKRRKTESPSGASSLAACPFQWLLTYACGIRPGTSAAIPGERSLVGSLAHELIERLLKAGISTADAEEKAGELFDSEGPRLAATLFMPGKERLKARSRRMMGRAARILLERMRDSGLTVSGTEVTRKVSALDTDFEGRIDIVLKEPTLILDMKSGGERCHREDLERGAAVQLACYSRIHSTDDAFPPAGYFILGSGSILTTEPQLIKGAVTLEGPSLRKTWDAFEQLYASQWERLEERHARTARRLDDGGKPEPEKSFLDKDGLRLAPPCAFCRFGMLCGFKWEVQ